MAIRDDRLPFRLLSMYATDPDHAGYAAAKYEQTPNRRAVVIAGLVARG